MSNNTIIFKKRVSTDTHSSPVSH